MTPPPVTPPPVTPPPGLIVRVAGPADLPTLAGMRWDWSVEDDGPHDGPRDGRAAFVAAFAAWAATVADTHRAFLAEDAGRPVGMAWLATVVRPPAPGAPRRRGGDLQTVYVVPDRRGRGVGAALLAAVVAYAEGDGLAHVTVRTGTRPRPFYRRHGFVDPDGVLIRNLSRPDVDPGPARSTRG